MSALMAFDAAARHASITRAADELALTESAVSRQISQLEDQLGVQLFHRVKKRLSLTRAGTAYARDVAGALERLEKDTFDVMSNQGEGGTLEIAVLPTVGSQWLIPRMTDFYERHPKLTVNISARSSRFLFSETHFDGALGFGAATWAGADSDFLFEEELAVVAGGRLMDAPSPWDAEKVLAQRLLHLVTRPAAWASWAAAAGVSGINLLKGPRFEQQAMVIGAVSAGQGLALLPPFLIEEQLARGDLRIVSDVTTRSEGSYYFAFPEEKAGEPQLRLFRDWLQEQALRFREERPAGGGREPA
ncbi:MAG TPA: LysR substrate-binding domain-containing protein [Ramlibacter sp.]|uniref:LysR substrate-binding domain-containing protein n=1 Tax=Ramlibacter sp. TaxID=1917967 RepID=UPI002D7F03F5|nr:LysR substrate-binding domain-containing protein [Ramlibacter sp.]HET8746995.1 LysR substrate-binding domain-containing protein [Ramlibacter sp.]